MNPWPSPTLQSLPSPITTSPGAALAPRAGTAAPWGLPEVSGLVLGEPTEGPQSLAFTWPQALPAWEQPQSCNYPNRGSRREKRAQGPEPGTPGLVQLGSGRAGAAHDGELEVSVHPWGSGLSLAAQELTDFNSSQNCRVAGPCRRTVLPGSQPVLQLFQSGKEGRPWIPRTLL